jgi:hypothetical protein
MVLLGWPTAVKPGHDYLSGHRPAIVPVTVQPEDWIGVYQSTFRQIRGPGHVAPVPPAHFVKEWDGIFAADLVTFQYSLAAGLRLGASTSFQLERAAADRYVREKYLDPCSEEERRDLYLLAWLAELGMPLAEELAPSRFQHSLRCGLIRSIYYGRLRDRVLFQSWHRSFSRLLLGCAPLAERKRRLCEAAASHPVWANQLANCLRQNSEDQLAVNVFEDALKRNPSLVDWLDESLNNGYWVFRQTKELFPTQWLNAITQVSKAKELDKLAAKVFKTPLTNLLTFFRLVWENADLQPVRDALVKALIADAKLPTEQSQLLAQAFATALGELATFLRFTERSVDLKPVHDALINALVADVKLPDNRSWLRAKAFITPLDFLAVFLRFTGQRVDFKPVYDALINALVADVKMPGPQSRLQVQASATRLNQLATFLRFTVQTKGLEPVQVALVQALATDVKLPADQSRLHAQAFATPLHDLVAFLRFTGQTEGLEPVQAALVQTLVADAKLPADQSRLLQVARNTKYENLRGFVKGVRAIPGLSAVADMVESDAFYAKTLRGEVQTLASVRVETSTPTPTPIPQPPQPLPPVDDLKPLQLRSQLVERIQIGIERVLTEAWEAVPDATPAEERFKVARRCAQESIARLSPHIKRQVGAHFNASNWEELKARNPKP